MALNRADVTNALAGVSPWYWHRYSQEEQTMLLVSGWSRIVPQCGQKAGPVVDAFDAKKSMLSQLPSDVLPANSSGIRKTRCNEA